MASNVATLERYTEEQKQLLANINAANPTLSVPEVAALALEHEQFHDRSPDAIKQRIFKIRREAQGKKAKKAAGAKTGGAHTPLRAVKKPAVDKYQKTLAAAAKGPTVTKPAAKPAVKPAVAAKPAAVKPAPRAVPSVARQGAPELVLELPNGVRALGTPVQLAEFARRMAG